jgi:hypothetical protein
MPNLNDSEDLTMLKIVKTSLAIIVSSFVFSASVQADDNGQLRKKIKVVEVEYRINVQSNDIAGSLSDDSLIRSTLVSNPMEAGTLLVRKLPKGDVNVTETDGKGVYARSLQRTLTESTMVLTLNDSI